MKKYYKLSLNQIPKEAAGGGGFFESPQLKFLEKTASDRVEDITIGSLPSGSSYDFHMHKGIDEVAIIVSGSGKFVCGNEQVSYAQGDVFIIPSESMHKFAAEGAAASEFYFIRVKV